MTSIFYKNNFLYSLLIIAVLIGTPVIAFAESSTYDDPFYDQKGTDHPVSGTTSTFQKVSESIDPFTGNLNLIHTDAILPGNGGLDLKIQRSYNGRIWGRRDVTNPGLVAYAIIFLKYKKIV